jgi:hypothetical protein
VFKFEEVSLAKGLPTMCSVPKEGERRDAQLLVFRSRCRYFLVQFKKCNYLVTKHMKRNPESP